MMGLAWRGVVFLRLVFLHCLGREDEGEDREKEEHEYSTSIRRTCRTRRIGYRVFILKSAMRSLPGLPTLLLLLLLLFPALPSADVAGHSERGMHSLSRHTKLNAGLR
jgi:hypothetical protein